GLGGRGRQAKMTSQDCGDATTGVTLPKWGHWPRFLTASRQNVGDGTRQRVTSNQLVCAVCDGHRTLRIGSQRQARHPHDSGLFLHATGVSDDGGGTLNQAEEFDISERVDHNELLMIHETCSLKSRAPPRMQWDDDLYLVGDRVERLYQ